MALQHTEIEFPKSQPSFIGPAVRGLRKVRGLSLSDLSRLTGLSRGALSGIENGKKLPSAASLGALADALHCFTDYLLFRSRVDTQALEALARDLAAFPCCWPGGCGDEARCLPCRARRAIG